MHCTSVWPSVPVYSVQLSPQLVPSAGLSAVIEDGITFAVVAGGGDDDDHEDVVRERARRAVAGEDVLIAVLPLRAHCPWCVQFTRRALSCSSVQEIVRSSPVYAVALMR